MTEGGCALPAAPSPAAAPRRGGPVGRETFGVRYARKVHSRNIGSGRHALLLVAAGSALVGTLALADLLQQIKAQQIEHTEGDFLLWSVLFAMAFGPSVVFVGLWYWARKNPVAAGGIGLGLYSLYVALELVLTSGASLLELGMLLKVAILVTLIYAVKSAIAFRRLPVTELKA